MSIATQIERLQGVRDQIRTKMVGLGLSENTDLLQNLADDLDGVDKISPTNNGTTDPGTGYTNVDTLSRSTSTRYIKIPKGYNDTNRKFTVSGVANGAYSASVASHTTSNASASSSVTGSVTGVTTTTKPSGTDGTDYYTITPKLTTSAGSSKATGKATIDTAGYLAAGNKSSSESSKSVGVTATQGDNYYLKAGSYSASVASHTTSNATASSNVSGSIVNVTSTTKPSGTDGSDYFTITPTLTTSAGSSKATGKATVDTAGYLATGNTTSEESSKSVGVTADQGSNYYLKASSVTKENPGVDPGNRYGNRATVDPSMVDQYVKITGGYLSDSKITIKKMTEGSVSSATTTDPGTENQTTVTPSLDKQYVKISAGHLPHGKITVEAIPNQKKSSDVSAEVSASISNITSIDVSQVTSGVTVTASASGNMTVPLGYYSSAVTSTPTDSASTTIKPTLAGTNSDGAVSITASTTDIVKTSAGDYSNGFITKVTVSPTPSEEKTVTPANTTQTVTPTKGKLLSKVTVNAIPSPYFDTSGVTATASTVLEGYKFVNSSGTTVTGTIVSRGDASATLSTSTRSKTLSAGYYTGGTIKVPDNYYPLTSSNTTATEGTVLSGYKFVNTSGSTVTGTIATASSSNISGSVSGSNPEKITLTTEETSKSSTTTATAEATVTKGLYTGSSNIVADLTSKDFTATAEAKLAASVTGTDKIPSTLPAGTVTITPNTDNTKRIYSDSTNKGFVTNVVLEAMPAGSYSPSVASHNITNPTASSSVTGSVTSIASTTEPSGTDGTDYYTITPELTTKAGSSKAKGKATISTAGYLSVGSDTSPESSKSVKVEASPGKSYYLKASSVTKEDPGTSYVNKATVTPSTSAQYVKVTAGYLPNSKITVEAIPNQKGKDDVTATVTADVSDITSINASQVTDGVTVTASASGSTVVPVGYYSTQVSKTPGDSKSTTIKPKLAGTNGAIELTARTSAFTKTSTTDYSNGFITRVTVNPTPSSAKEFTPTRAGGTVSPDAGKLLSSVTVKGVPYFSVTLSSSSWKSDSDVTAGKYYYDVSDANITDSGDLYIAPGNGSVSAAQSFGVYAYSQIKMPWASKGTLRFRAIEKPTSDLTYNVFYLS